MRRLRILAAVGAAALLGVAMPLPVGAQAQEVLVKTDYPSVVVEPGQTVGFDLEVITSEPRHVDLRVVDIPEGWQATLRGGGYVIHGVFGDPEVPPSVELEVRVPPEAEPGEHTVNVEGSGGGVVDTLSLRLIVAERAPAAVSLDAEFPSLQGSADDSFSSRMTLENQTPEETAFNLETEGPPGWVVEASPSAEPQAATVTVEAGDTADINVDIEPGARTPADEYPVVVRAVGPGDKVAEEEVLIEITGSRQLQLSTADERLNGDVRAGSPTELALVVRNEGTAPLEDVSLSASPPSGWEVNFSPTTVETVAPGGAERVTAEIVPSGEAVAGDYTISFSATGGGGGDDSIEYRAAVQPSRFWVVVGVLLIVAALVGLRWMFLRYGRR